MFSYNKSNQLVSTDLHCVDTLNGVDSHEITLYEYDGRNLVTREVNALGDLVQKINYKGAQEVSYQYNKVGEAGGDSGELTFQGTRYLNFRREGAE